MYFDGASRSRRGARTKDAHDTIVGIRILCPQTMCLFSIPSPAQRDVPIIRRNMKPLSPDLNWLLQILITSLTIYGDIDLIVEQLRGIQREKDGTSPLS